MRSDTFMVYRQFLVAKSAIVLRRELYSIDLSIAVITPLLQQVILSIVSLLNEHRSHNVISCIDY